MKIFNMSTLPPTGEATVGAIGSCRGVVVSSDTLSDRQELSPRIGERVMDAESIKMLIVDRLTLMQDFRTDHARQFHECGVVRGLIWALIGKDVGDLRSTQKILEAADIPFDFDGEMVVVPEKWLLDHGMRP